EEQVRWFEVAMHDAERVDLGQPHHGLQQVVDRRLERPRTALLELGAEITPVEHLHDQVGHSRPEAAEVEYPDEVRARGPSGEPPLTQKPRAQRRVGRELRAHELDGDLLAELRIPRRGDQAHATGAQDLLDDVPPADALLTQRLDELALVVVHDLPAY